MRAFLLRMAGEQMTWQVPEYETLARTAAIFAQTPPLQPMECLLPGWDTELFGCTLQEYVGTAQLVWVSAVNCAGRFDLAVFDTPDGKLIARHVSRDTVTRVLDAHFATSIEQFRADNQDAAARAGRDDQLRRYTYNPLRGRPLLTGFGPGYLCPIPQLAWAKATPWGVYFTGLDHYGERFARDLGHLFEQYIGRQLRLLPGAQVLPEITYGPKNGRRKTVDWIVVLPEVVLLVEVKSAIPTEPVRLGTPDAADAIVGKLGKAVKQIDVTAQLIADRDPALAAVPADRSSAWRSRWSRSTSRTRSTCCQPRARRSPSRTPPRSRSWSRSPTRPRPAPTRPRHRRCPLHLVPGHRAGRPRTQPEPDPRRSMELLPMGIGRPRTPRIVTLNQADLGKGPPR